ncbi:MAG: hypothetical protein FWB80_07770 [Defluviitaleaceae bacterium]|nr:hypothetical protein [Defluviitaleaceae bacterium]
MIPIIDPDFKGLIPPLSDEEREQLEHNILEGGCRDAIITWQGIIIDGHNRFDICTKHGITFGIREMEFDNRDDVLVWIIENQLGRRNLSDAARIELALQKAELLKQKAKQKQIRAGRDRHRAGELNPKTSICQKEPIYVLDAVADDAGVSRGTVHSYAQIQKEGSPQLVEKVKNGEMKIGSAHRLLGKEIIKQLKIADGMYKYIIKNIPIEDDDDTNNAIYQGLYDLQKKLMEVNSWKP